MQYVYVSHNKHCTTLDGILRAWGACEQGARLRAALDASMTPAPMPLRPKL